MTAFSEFVARYSIEDAVFSKAQDFFAKASSFFTQYVKKPKRKLNNLQEWIWVATATAKWILHLVELFGIVSRRRIDCPRPSRLQFHLAPPNPGDWNRFYLRMQIEMVVLGTIGQNPSVSKSDRLLVVIFRFFVYPQIATKRSLVFVPRFLNFRRRFFLKLSWFVCNYCSSRFSPFIAERRTLPIPTPLEGKFQL